MFLIKLNLIFAKIKRIFVGLTEGIRKNLIFWIFIIFAIGIVFNEQWRPSVWVGVYGALTGILLIFCIKLRNKVFFIIFMIAVFFLGMLHCRAVSFLPEDHIFYLAKRLDRKNSQFIGRVGSDVKKSLSFGGSQRFEFILERVIDGKGKERDVQGKVLVRAFKKDDVFLGDRLAIKGSLHKPFEFKSSGKSSYGDYLRQRKIYFMLSVGKAGAVEYLDGKVGVFTRVRERLKQNFDEYLPDFDAGILKAVILGDRTHIDRDVRGVFSRTGTAHILAISGLHMGIILMVFLFVLGFIPVSQKIKFIIAMILLIFYLPLAGGRVSVIRSGIMSVLFLYSFVAERRACSLNALGVAGLIILLINPLDLYAVGFQLSFSAVIALILLYSHIFHFIEKIFGGVKKVFLQSFAASLSAWIGVAGWVMLYFGMFTPIGLIANICVVFMMSGVIALGLLLALVGVLGFKGFGIILALNIKVILRILIYFVVVLDRIPFGSFSGIELEGWMCVGYYGVLIILVLLIKIRTIKKAL